MISILINRHYLGIKKTSHIHTTMTKKQIKTSEYRKFIYWTAYQIAYVLRLFFTNMKKKQFSSSSMISTIFSIVIFTTSIFISITWTTCTMTMFLTWFTWWSRSTSMAYSIHKKETAILKRFLNKISIYRCP